MMHSCPSNLLNRTSADPNAYCSVVADACRFNRGLCRGRLSRLPFLDMATQTSQRPAPWFYRTSRERSRDLLEGGTHVVLRYMRHRWRLDYQTPTRRRKLAADRLWFTLRTGLTALGIPLELIPLITKRAYAIADLPIPPGLAPHLEAMIAKNAANSNQTNGTAVPPSNRIYTSNTIVGTKKSELGTDPSNRKTTGRDDEDSVVDEASFDSTDLLGKQLSVSLVHNRALDASASLLAAGEDSASSKDNVCLKRTASDDGVVCTEAKTDDELSLQSGNGTKVGSTSESLLARNKYDLSAYDVEDESAEDDDDDDEEELDDDVEWVQSRGRRSYHTLPGRRSFGSPKRRRRALARRRGGRFSIVGTRLPTRRVVAGSLTQASRSFGGRQKRSLDRSLHRTDFAANSSRGSLSGRGRSAAGSSSNFRESESIDETHWDEFAEPGFQPNANFCSLPFKTNEDVSGPIMLGSTINQTNHYTSPSPLSSNLLSVGEDSIGALRDSTTNSARNSPLPDTRRSTMTPASTPQPSMSPENSSSAQSFSSRITMAQLLSSSNDSGGSSNMLSGINNFATSSTSSSTAYDYPPASSCEGMSYKGMHSSANRNVPPNVFQPSKSLPGKEGTTIGSLTSRNPDFPAQTASSTNNSRASPVRAGTDSFTPPPGATTTVTFFVCEVCASRYRSTAGLRYHYHSQHSGYTPKNPISASASRLVVPVGEERGIGGGLRGGRPRRHKGSNLENRGAGRGKSKESSDAKGQVRAGTSLLSAHDSLSSDHRASPHPETFGSAYTGHYIPSASQINRPPEGSSSTQHPTSRPFMRPAWMDHYANRAVDDCKSVASSIGGLLTTAGNQPLTSTSGNLVELTATSSQQRPNTLQSLAAMETTVSSSMPYTPRSQAHIPPTVSSSTISPYAPSWNVQDPYTGVPSEQPYTPYRFSPTQRRFERQRCPDRVNLNVSGIPTCVYCLGEDRLNPRIGRPEGLLRCYTCGTWGHFSCVQLPPHVIEMAMRYPWQCINCKTCLVCGSPEQEARMAFCSDCDRTFHIDCLPNPLPRVPTTHWSCYICMHELYAMPPSSTTTLESQY